MRPHPVKQLVTDYDNETYDIGRTLALVYFCCAILFTAVSVFFNHTFDVMSFLSGGGAFLGGLGVYIFGDARGKQNASNVTPTP